MSPVSCRVLVIDNYDSFTHNIVQALRLLSADVHVAMNDEVGVGDVARAGFDGVLLSPGPCTPDEAGITVPLARALAGKIPLLGVCLGHQAIAQAFGARIVRAGTPRHGKSSAIEHDARGSLGELPSPFDAGRYHSLIVDATSLPASLQVTATSSDDGALMAFFDPERDVEGLQFHPESVLTPLGPRIFESWLRRIARRGATSCS